MTAPKPQTRAEAIEAVLQQFVDRDTLEVGEYFAKYSNDCIDSPFEVMRRFREWAAAALALPRDDAVRAAAPRAIVAVAGRATKEFDQARAAIAHAEGRKP